MQRKLKQHRGCAALVVAGLALCVPGCVSARDTKDVASTQAETIDRLAVESAITNAALLDATGALASIRIELIASGADASIIAELITPGGEPDHDRLDAQVAQAEPPTNPLAAQVREGRMTIEGVHAWLTAYAAALNSPQGASTRRRLLNDLTPVASVMTDSARLLAALRARAETSAGLFTEARASAGALLGAASSDPDIDALLDSATHTWATMLLDGIDDPEQRAAARHLFDSILDLTDIDTMTTGAAQ